MSLYISMYLYIYIYPKMPCWIIVDTLMKTSNQCMIGLKNQVKYQQFLAEEAENKNIIMPRSMVHLHPVLLHVSSASSQIGKNAKNVQTEEIRNWNWNKFREELQA